MAPLSLIEIAETIAEAQKNYAASNMKSADGAYMMGTTAFFLSLSGSFAIQIALRSKLPARLRHSAIPIGFACAVALSVPKYLKHGPTTSKHVEDALHTVSPTTLW